MKKNLWSIAIGLILVVVGVGILLNALFDWNLSIFIKGWWALALMILSLSYVISEGPKTWNISAVLIFGLLFARNYITLLQKVDIWMLVVGIVVLSLAVKIVISGFNPNVDNKKEIEVEAVEKETNDN